MCGITGLFAFNLIGKINKINVTAATMALSKRGPDHQDIYHDDWVALGHRRLSIIDTREVANQPMWDESNRYSIIYNGEIFNFRELRIELEAKGARFRTNSDTEVLLAMYIYYGVKCLDRLNGFFGLCIYDKQEQSMFLARDQFGIKPLFFLFDEDKFLFASEMKSLLQYGVEKNVDKSALLLYLQLNYVPAPLTILKGINKLQPGHYIIVKKGKIEINRYYTLPYDARTADENPISYENAKKQLSTLVEGAVRQRLVSDVPLGSFLSGGIDSSIITGIASRHQSDFHTFSIGFSDEKYFDETEYARLVARHFGTKHSVFSLTSADMYSHVHAILDYTDEPFADSSGIAVYVLSRETRKHATVALSGDGADEIFGGYNKHEAAMLAINPGIKGKAAAMIAPLARLIPQSRNSAISNAARQITRFSEGLRMSSQERYWRWASMATSPQSALLLRPEFLADSDPASVDRVKRQFIDAIPEKETLNDILFADMHLVLPNDMLAKVDMMSMAHGLEVRPPFLDKEVVRFAFSLPSHFKIGGGIRKRILQDAFKEMLPAQLYNRPKKGFEVPMLRWLRKEMKPIIEDELLSKAFIVRQGIFNYEEISRLKSKLHSSNPGDVHARVWGLIVFQWWWKKYFPS